MGSAGDAANKLRNVRMRQALTEAIEKGEEKEVLRNGRTITDVYVEKLAQFRLLTEVTTTMYADIEKRIAKNDEIMKNIFDHADKLLRKSDGPWLFGKAPCMADGFFATLVFRIGDVDAGLQRS